MSYDDWPDQTIENRRKVVRETIRPATYEELKELGEKRFPVATDPWCEKYHQFLNQHKNSRFFLAETPEGAEIAYCREANNAIWFLPGKGMGVIQPKGLQVLAEIVDAL